MKFDRTKIIATLGPASNNAETLTEMVKAGLDVCRLNFSHGTHDEHEKNIQLVRKVAAEQKTNLGVLVDLQGPKLRVGMMQNDGVFLIPGEKIILSTDESIGNAEKLYLNYYNLARDVQPGEKILLDDGKIELQVISSNKKNEVECEIIYGGKLLSKKGVNFPNTKLSIPSITDKDKLDLLFGLKHDVEWIGLSFVRSADDILELKKLIAAQGKHTRVIAKIEKPEGVHNIDEIIEVADAIMVARGDMGVELDMEKVPIIQKTIVRKCIKHSKPVIIATQMMESMINSPTPTRAETNDVTNAVLDGADAVMLSAETSIGKYPSIVVEKMRRIVHYAEMQEPVYRKNKKLNPNSITHLSDEVCFHATLLADTLGARAIVGMTVSGYSAFKISSYRPHAPIFIFTNQMQLLNMVNLIWGVRGIYYDRNVGTDETFAEVNSILKQQGYVTDGDIIINTASMPVGELGRTNAIKVSVVK